MIIYPEAGWLRLWRGGPGVAWKPAAAPLLFSQRTGITRTFVLGGYRWRFLRSCDARLF